MAIATTWTMQQIGELGELLVHYRRLSFAIESVRLTTHNGSARIEHYASADWPEAALLSAAGCA